MPTLTDPSVADAIRKLYEASVERGHQLEAMVLLHDLDHRVISALHDLLIESESRQGQPLRSVS